MEPNEEAYNLFAWFSRPPEPGSHLLAFLHSTPQVRPRMRCHQEKRRLAPLHLLLIGDELPRPVPVLPGRLRFSHEQVGLDGTRAKRLAKVVDKGLMVDSWG